MPTGIHVADWSERLKRAGIELIATKVEEESQVLALMELNVTLAQGYLLGEPRPLREAV
jgi:cyclic-di-GMP phosphodiesterase TipF (flagellum assembly factor)